MLSTQIFTLHQLDENHEFWTAYLPGEINFNQSQFDELWDMHPSDFKELKIHGRLVKTPRWQEVYGVDYHYTGVKNKALPIPSLLKPLHQWSQHNIDNCLNGMVINWYDGQLGHYMGKHRDSTVNMVQGTSIVIISFGEERIFRLRPWKGKGYKDFTTTQGSVFVIPYQTNKTWTHEIISSKRHLGRRISITFRGFEVNE